MEAWTFQLIFILHQPVCVIYEADLPSSPRPDLFAGAHVGLGVGEEGLHCIQRWCRIQLKAQHAKTRSRR
jgi:hypothetical protein